LSFEISLLLFHWIERSRLHICNKYVEQKKVTQAI